MSSVVSLTRKPNKICFFKDLAGLFYIQSLHIHVILSATSVSLANLSVKNCCPVPSCVTPTAYSNKGPPSTSPLDAHHNTLPLP